MLTKKDKSIIEKYLDHKLGHPDAEELNLEEKQHFKKRLGHESFKRHFQLSELTNKAISDDSAIKVKIFK